MELIDYILEPAIPFGIVIWLFWRLWFRDEYHELFSDKGERE